MTSPDHGDHLTLSRTKRILTLALSLIMLVWMSESTKGCEMAGMKAAVMQEQTLP